ncbi:MAG: MFS transporter [Chloroflexia bacterium]
MFLLAMPFGLLGVYLPLYGLELGASASQVGALFTVFSLAGVLARPLVGMGADRFGRRPFILAGAAFYTLSAALFALSFNLPLLYSARIAQGVGSALFWVGIYALLADIGDGGRQGEVFGRLAGAVSAAAAIGILPAFGIVMLLGVTAGWRWSFAGFALISLVALRLFFGRIPTARLDRPTPIARPATGRTLVFLSLIALLVSASYSMIFPILLIYLQDRFNAGVFMVGVAFAPAAVVYAAAPGRFGALGDRWNRRWIIALSLVASGVVSLLFPLAPSLLVMTLVWVLEALLVSAALPAQNAVVSELIGGDVRGRAYGFYAAVAGLGAAAGPLVGGWLYDHAGRAYPFWINAAILPVAAALILWKLPEPVRSARVALGQAVATDAEPQAV